MALTDPVPSQAIDVFKRNMEDSDRFVNQISGTVTNRTGKTMRPLPVISDAIEQQITDLTADINAAKADLYPIVKFRFLVDSYTITNRNELGDTATGETYRYVGATLPFNVTPATNPVGNPDFVQVIQTDHNNLTNRNAVGAHDDIYTRNFKTVIDLRDQTDASGNVINLASLSGNRIFWRGYYTESDGGSNWGIVKTGDSTGLVDDGGSIFVIVNDAVNGVWVEANLKGKSVNVRKFGAKGDDLQDDTAAIKNAFAYAKSYLSINSGAHVHFPKGVFRVSETIDYYTNSAAGMLITGAGYNVTVVKWMGAAGALFSNEQPVPTDSNYKFQYGFNLRDMTLATNGAARPAGSVGLHTEMLQNKAEVRNVVIFGFDMGCFVGIHAEMLTVSNSYIAYNRIGMWGQGDQVDVLTLRSVTFSYNVERGLLISCPRPNILHCHFNEGQISDPAVYRDIQVGYSKIRPQDIGKSAYATADKGNDGSRARFINNSFEGLGNKAAVLFQNFDTRAGIGGGNITFEMNKAALYTRPAFLEVVDPYFNVKFSGTQLSSTNPNTCLINDPNAITGSYIIDEPAISKVWADLTQYLRNGMSLDYYKGLPQLACDLQHSSDWTFSRSDDGISKIDMDVDGEGTIAISYDEPLFTGTPSIQIQNTACPAGFVYVSLPLSKIGTNLGLEVEVKDAANNVLYFNKFVNLSSATKNKCFGFNNPVQQSITIRIFPKPFSGDVGTFSLRRPSVKHFNGQTESWFLEDTRTGKYFTRRSNQIFELAPKIQYAEVYDYNDLTNGAMFCDAVKLSTLNGSYSTGAVSFDVSDASGLSVGMFAHFKPVTSAGVSRPHFGSLSGNKIVSISGNSITVGTGLPFNVSSGDTVVFCRIYRKQNATML